MRRRNRTRYGRKGYFRGKSGRRFRRRGSSWYRVRLR